MVIVASDIAHGRVRTTTTTTAAELPNMAALLQIIGWQRHAALVYRVLPWYWTSMLWSIDTCQIKVSADQYHHIAGSSLQLLEVPCLLNLTADQILVIDWIAGSCWVSLLETGQDCSEAGLRWPRIKVYRIITFSSIQMFFCCFVLCIWWLLKIKTEGQTIYRNLTAKLQNSNQNSPFLWVSLIGLWTTRPRSYAFRLA